MKSLFPKEFFEDKAYRRNPSEAVVILRQADFEEQRSIRKIIEGKMVYTARSGVTNIFNATPFLITIITF